MELAQLDRSLQMLRQAMADADKVADADDSSHRAAILRQHYRQVRVGDLVTLLAAYDRDPARPDADTRIEHLRRLVASVAKGQTPNQLGDLHVTIDAGSVAALIDAATPRRPAPPAAPAAAAV